MYGLHGCNILHCCASEASVHDEMDHWPTVTIWHLSEREAALFFWHHDAHSLLKYWPGGSNTLFLHSPMISMTGVSLCRVAPVISSPLITASELEGQPRIWWNTLSSVLGLFPLTPCSVSMWLTPGLCTAPCTAAAYLLPLCSHYTKYTAQKPEHYLLPSQIPLHLQRVISDFKSRKSFKFIASAFCRSIFAQCTQQFK